MGTEHPVSQPWIWEYGTLDGSTVYDTREYWDLSALKAAIDASFSDYVYEEVERRGIRGTSVLVSLSGDGRYQDTGHWVYRATQGSVVKRRREALTVLDRNGLYPKTDSPLPLEVLEQLAAVLLDYGKTKVGERDHARQYWGATGWHAWTPPTTRQIKTRMLERRVQRQGAFQS